MMLKERGRNCRYIIIDEPELSLSVSWQKTLISDLLTLSPKSYIVSATHSPFIFDSFGLENVKSLGAL
jgi:predicted ATP-binding protein involved in virulence